jgi:hypothetical protein
MFRKVNIFMRGRFRGDGVRPRMRTVMAERARKHTRRPSVQHAGVPSEGFADRAKDAPDVGGGLSAFLYDADGDDREVALDGALVDGLADSDLLWVDVDSRKEAVAGGRQAAPRRLRVHVSGSDEQTVHPRLR